MAVLDIELLLIDLRLIEFHRALVLLHDVDLVLILLARDRILLGEFLVAGEIDLRLREHALIARELAFVLCLQQAVGPVVYLGQCISLVDDLPLGEGHRYHLTVNLRHHGYGRDRRDRSERVQHHANIAAAYGGDADGLGGAGLLRARG